MAKIVEIYREEEISVADEAKDMSIDGIETQTELVYIREIKSVAEKLGYAGQKGEAERFEKRLIAKYNRITKGIPYPRLTSDQWKVIRAYFNEEQKITCYAREIMPLLVLREVVNAESAEIFDKIMVFYHRDPNTDPLICGLVDGDDEKEWYPIARFGDALQKWEWFKSYYTEENDLGFIACSLISFAVFGMLSCIIVSPLLNVKC